MPLAQILEMVVLGFNATLIAKVISWRLGTHMCFLAFSQQYKHNFSFKSHRLLFPHASAEVRGENTPERKVASIGDRTRNHQVMSPTRLPLSHPGGVQILRRRTAQELTIMNEEFLLYVMRIDLHCESDIHSEKGNLLHLRKVSSEKLKFVMGWVENIMGKGENAGSQHFLLFPQCFQKASL